MEHVFTAIMLFVLSGLSLIAFVIEFKKPERTQEFLLGWLFLASFLSFIGLVLFIV